MYEDGMNYTDQIDRGYGRERYVKGMQWINKYAQSTASTYRSSCPT
jgi:hypothetical protein